MAPTCPWTLEDALSSSSHRSAAVGRLDQLRVVQVCRLLLTARTVVDGRAELRRRPAFPQYGSCIASLAQHLYNQPHEQAMAPAVSRKEHEHEHEQERSKPVRKTPFVFCPTCGERVYCVEVKPGKTVRDVCTNGHWVRYDIDEYGYVRRERDTEQHTRH